MRYKATLPVAGFT